VWKDLKKKTWLNSCLLWDLQILQNTATHCGTELLLLAGFSCRVAIGEFKLKASITPGLWNGHDWKASQFAMSLLKKQHIFAGLFSKKTWPFKQLVACPH